MRRAVLRKRLCISLATSVVTACNAAAVDTTPTAPTATPKSSERDQCANSTVHEDAAPTTQPRHRRASFWLELPGVEPDHSLMTPAQITALNKRYAADVELFRDPLSVSTADDADIRKRWTQRDAWMAEKLTSGSYVEPVPGAMAQATTRIQQATLRPEFHIIAEESALWCVPTTEGILSRARDVAFDRNRCTGLHPGEVVLATHTVEGEPWVHVEAGHSNGWLYDPQWTPPLSREEVSTFLTNTPRGYVVEESTGEGGTPALRIGTSLPFAGPLSETATVVAPTANGLAPTPFDRRQFHEGPLPLTKRHVIELAFSQLHAPYGWGGYLGNRDCSRFLHDILASFDILMARNSAAQSTMGAHNIGLEGMSDAEKLSTIEELNTDNLVLLYMPGHIMLYLGNDGADHFALSSLSEYLRPCDDGGAQTVRLDRVEVTPLELGRGTSRTSFVERMTTAVVFGPG